MKNTTKKTLTTKGNLFLIDQAGELQDLGQANITSKREDLNKNFFMLFNSGLIKGKTGIFQLDFIFYLLEKMTNKNTIPFITDERIARDLNVCRQTVETFKKKLRAAGILKYEARGIFINPEFVFKGNAYKRADCVAEYKHFDGIGDDKSNYSQNADFTNSYGRNFSFHDKLAKFSLQALPRFSPKSIRNALVRN